MLKPFISSSTHSPRLTLLPLPGRRFLLALHMTAAIVLAGALSASSALAAPRIASLNWTLAETLVALEAPPMALAQINDYVAWLGEDVPDSVTDIGLRTQPNMELLASMQPDNIIISPLFANLIPMLSDIAPVSTYSLYTGNQPVWTELEELTRQLGELSNREQQAEQLIAATNARMTQLAGRVPEQTRPLVVMQFMDARHARVFGEGSLYTTVVERLGLHSSWAKPTNVWGFTLVGIEQLMPLAEARLVVVEPYPAGVLDELAHSGLWQHLGSVQRGDVITLPPVWSFGSLPSASRFATSLVNALDTEKGR